MIKKFYQKSIIWILLGGFVVSCAPKYTANFQLKSHKADRYEIQNEETEKVEPLISSVDKVTVEDEIVIKEVVVDPKQIRDLESSEEVELQSPSTKEELLKTLKENPEATVAIDLDRLSNKEKRALKKETKRQLKAATNEMGTQQYNNEPNKLLYIILAIFIPPLAVGLWRGVGSDFWINLLLTLLFYVPGLVHAIIVITSKPKTTGGAY